MFTGIVEAVGTVVDLKPFESGYRLCIDTPLAAQLRPGDSLAVNGVCLTVILTEGSQVYADVGPQTVRVTTFAGLQRGRPINLERPLRVDSRLDGHIVQGHVDSVGTVDDVRSDAECYWLTIGFPAPLARYFIPKGSVAVDGVSLTVAGLGDRQFDVQIIPYTWQHTALHALKPSDHVNIECDMIGKYVARSLQLSGQGTGQKGG